MPLQIIDRLLAPASYLPNIYPKKSIFIHHTAGSYNPLNVIAGWDSDDRGRVATAFVIGGKSAKGNDDGFNGKVYRAHDERMWAYHLGLNDSALDKSSVGIEICNFGYLRKSGDEYYTYVDTKIPASQVTTLPAAFRGFTTYHSYTDEQLSSLRELLLQLANQFNIDIRKGLKEELRKEKLVLPPNLSLVEKQRWLAQNGFVGLDGLPIAADGIDGQNTRYALSCVGRSAFELNQQCLRGAPGLWTHTNVRPDKYDCFPQPGLKQLIESL